MHTKTNIYKTTTSLTSIYISTFHQSSIAHSSILASRRDPLLAWTRIPWDHLHIIHEWCGGVMSADDVYMHC